MFINDQRSMASATGYESAQSRELSSVGKLDELQVPNDWAPYCPVV